MTIVELCEPQETLSESETVVAELTDGTKLIRTPDAGIVRPPTDAGRPERKYERWTDATLYFGLWIETGGWEEKYPVTGTEAIPTDVVAAGNAAVAAYLFVGTGVTNSRKAVANMLGLENEQTVSNYASQIRFSPE